METLKYQDALDFLYSFIDYGSERSDRYSPDVFELDRIKRFLKRLNNPHQQYPAVHIAGTKGKGSVAALIASTLQRAGYNTGLYTSPHLIEFTERIRINGEEITRSEVVAGVDRLRPLVLEEPDITTYELMTALAFQYFADQAIDIGVFEVGLGGRLDSTNVVNPIVSIITSLSYDHMHLLGDTLAEIAAEKAGIIKHGVPVVSAPQELSAERVLQRIAAEREAPIEFVGRDWDFELKSQSLVKQRVRLWPTAANSTAQSVELDVGLLGEHQLENAAVAFAALQRVQGNGFPIPDKAYQQGFKKVQWPGRFQILSQNPTLVVDSAHNGYSAARLRQALQEIFPGSRVHLVFGASEDKDIEAMLRNLGPAVGRASMTQAVHPRAADPEGLVQTATRFIDQVDSVVPVEQAVARALQQANEEEVVLVTGSLFTVGEVLAWWANRAETKTAPSPPGEAL